MSGRFVLVPGLLMLALAGCGDSSDDSAQTQAPAPAPAPVAQPEQPAPPPVEVADAAPAPKPDPVVATPTPQVTVRARPARYMPMDLPASDGSGSAEAFPAEVTAFMVDRDGCDHFRGEDPYDADRRAFIAENIAELCTGTDARLSMLRRRYAGDAEVIAALKSYDARSEAVADN